MRRNLRGGQAVAAIAAGALLAGCQFAVVPPKKHTAASPAASLSNPYGYRLADAPALLTQCAVDTAHLQPGTGQFARQAGSADIAVALQPEEGLILLAGIWRRRRHDQCLCGGGSVRPRLPERQAADDV